MGRRGLRRDTVGVRRGFAGALMGARGHSALAGRRSGQNRRMNGTWVVSPAY